MPEYAPIPDPEVAEEWLRCRQRPDGLTSALSKARERLPILLSMKPETVEKYMTTIFSSID